MAKLTEKETLEIADLRAKRANRTRWMHQYEQDRLKELGQKELYNCCLNPHCTGYEGADDELNCKKCDSLLSKDWFYIQLNKVGVAASEAGDAISKAFKAVKSAKKA